tara:strand:- start:1276 stop:1536 length:261 start_codon:yes stop_codon:yes gene_type:complete
MHGTSCIDTPNIRGFSRQKLYMEKIMSEKKTFPYSDKIMWNISQKDVKHLQKLVGELMISQFTTQSQYKSVIDSIFESYMKGKENE